MIDIGYMSPNVSERLAYPPPNVLLNNILCILLNIFRIIVNYFVKSLMKIFCYYLE